MAGDRAGLDGDQSGLVLEFVRILSEMGDRSPRAVLLENVPGFLTINDGLDFDRVKRLLLDLGYDSQFLCVDAAAFVPQSRPRVFVLGIKGGTCHVPDPPERRNDLRLFDVVNRRSEWWNGERKEQFLASLSDLQAERLERQQKNQLSGRLSPNPRKASSLGDSLR